MRLFILVFILLLLAIHVPDSKLDHFYCGYGIREHLLARHLKSCLGKPPSPLKELGSQDLRNDYEVISN